MGGGLEEAKERWGKNEIINQCLIRPKTSIFVGQNGANWGCISGSDQPWPTTLSKGVQRQCLGCRPVIHLQNPGMKMETLAVLMQ